MRRASAYCGTFGHEKGKNLIINNMASLNKVILIGRLGKDPDVLSFENGSKKMTVTLATSERYRDRDGNWSEQTEWHNLVAWGALAQDIADKRRNYIKGDLMYVEGKIRSRQYVDAQNTTRYITEIVVDKMMNIGQTRQPGAAPQEGAKPNYNPIEATQKVQPFAPETMTSDEAENDLPF